ncbi:GNAT family N-acetyltransferase [Pseudanabaena sp. FACHB-2040]|uniref:GNAT family N-acetyltransferase n=1 Tax=Pseudanabaena sp. FACHB-2040 TaxID=2692859 RepID=UPI0016869FAA|nr:GNAT family N-acetyltransferase [Pseudanabaena sp. FACHB-2040]MBD2261040.1 GNAT family N-acetyltransferase [Pseudanabaena sp. FACHB-2040]
MKISDEDLAFVFLADRQDAIPTVAQWYYEEWGKVPGNSVEKTIKRIRGKLNRHKPPFHILAVSKDRVLGVAQFKLREMSIYPEREFWLGSLFVAPKFRGYGVGSVLAEKIAAIANDFGVKELYLQTESLDGGLYKRLGWNVIETTEYNNVRVAVMVRQLSE